MAQVVVVVRGNLESYGTWLSAAVSFSALLSLHLAEVRCLAGDEQADDETEEAQNRAENLNDQDLNEERRVRGVRQGCTAAVDAHRNTADQVANAHGQARPEESEAGVVCLGVVQLLALDAIQLG